MISDLSVVCHEPEGTFQRNVSMVSFTPRNLKRFYEQASQFPILFGRPLTGFNDFVSRFIWWEDGGIPHLHGPVWQIDDFVGVFYLNDLYVDEATAHFAFFDRRLKGRQALVKRLIREVFATSSLNRINVEIPYYARNAIRKFVIDVGFQLEGKKRQCRFYEGRWFDADQFGILRSEVLDGS